MKSTFSFYDGGGGNGMDGELSDFLDTPRRATSTPPSPQVNRTLPDLSLDAKTPTLLGMPSSSSYARQLTLHNTSSSLHPPPLASSLSSENLPSYLLTNSPPQLLNPEPQRKLLDFTTTPRMTQDIELQDEQLREQDPDVGAVSGDEVSSSSSAQQQPMTTGKMVAAEAVQLTRMSVPISLSFFVDNAASTITLFFLGHMGAAELAAGSLGLTLCNTTGWSFGSGMLSAMDTQAAIAYGAGKKKRVGLITQRAFWIITLYCLPVALLWCFAEQLLVALKQDPEISALAGKFVFWMLPGLISGMWFEVARRYLQALGIVTPAMVVIICSLPTSALFLYVLIKVYDLGLVGCSIAISLSNWTQFFMIFAFILGRRHLRAYWPGWTWRAFGFKPWWRFLRMAIPGALMGGMEGWGFDIMSLFAGWIGTVQLAVHSALINTYYLLYMVPLGVSVATTTRVGTLLGMRDIRRCKVSWYLSMALCVGFQMLLTVFMILARYQIAAMFCTDPEVIELYVRMLPLMCGIMVIDGAQISAAGALRGIGKQRLGMIANFVSFYILGIPGAYVLAFVVGQNLLGVWFGLGICDVVSAGVFTAALFMYNWTKAMDDIIDEDGARGGGGGGLSVVGPPNGHDGVEDEIPLAPPPKSPSLAFYSTDIRRSQASFFKAASTTNATAATAAAAAASANEKSIEFSEDIEEEEEDGSTSPDLTRRRVRDDDEDEDNEDDNDDEGDEDEDDEEEETEEDETSDEKTKQSSEQVSETEDEEDEEDEKESDESSDDDHQKKKLLPSPGLTGLAAASASSGSAAASGKKKLLVSSSRIRPKDLPPPLPDTIQDGDF